MTVQRSFISPSGFWRSYCNNSLMENSITPWALCWCVQPWCPFLRFSFMVTQPVLDLVGYFQPPWSHKGAGNKQNCCIVAEPETSIISLVLTSIRYAHFVERKAEDDQISQRIRFKENKRLSHWTHSSPKCLSLLPTANSPPGTVVVCWEDVCCFLGVLGQSELDQSHLTGEKTVNQVANCFPFVWVDLERLKSDVLHFMFIETIRRANVGGAHLTERGFCICGIYCCPNDL